MNIPESILDATAARYSNRAVVREQNGARIRKHDIAGANDPEHFRRRMERLKARVAAASATVPGGYEDVAVRADIAGGETFVNERVLGTSDFVGVVYLELGLRAAATVGRIRVKTRTGADAGYGTGSLVGANLLLTNNHVLSDAAASAFSVVEFNYQVGVDGQIPIPVTFNLDPATFFITSKELDYTLIAVKQKGSDAMDLSHFGWNPMIAKTGKVANGECVNIIQHPSAEPKQVALRENQIIDILDDYLHYKTDTAPGSSGAPVYNDEWELVALHHSGVPERDAQGNILTRDGKPYAQGMPDSLISWIANEGVRISRIVANLQARRNELSTEQQVLLDATVKLGEDEIAPAISSIGPASVTMAAAGGPYAFSASAELMDRGGYDPSFLGSDDPLSVPLPVPAGSIAGEVAPLKTDPNAHELKYTHFSVVMNRFRRLALFTAVNIDGNQSKQYNREIDTWQKDPRMDRRFQVGNELYKSNTLDRGHLVRRLDPVWGDDPIAKQAELDTFHYTNCAPQHEELNQVTWLSLEDYILANTDKHDLRITVFTGPMFRDDDRIYRDLQIPEHFWKVVVMVNRQTRRLSATGYMLSQQNLISDLEAFSFGPFKTYQVPITRIEEATLLDFGRLREFDPLNTFDRLLETAPVGERFIEVTGRESLIF